MIILFILVWGMAAGWLASLITGRGRGDWGLLITVGLGGSFVGSLLAGFIAGDGLDPGLRASSAPSSERSSCC